MSFAGHRRASTINNITYGVYKHLCPVQHDRYLLCAVLVWAEDYFNWCTSRDIYGTSCFYGEVPTAKMVIEL